MLVIDAENANKEVILTRTGCIWFLWLNIIYSLYLVVRYYVRDLPDPPLSFQSLFFSLVILLFSGWNLLLTSQLIRHQFYLSRTVLCIFTFAYGVVWGLVLHNLFNVYASLEFTMLISLVILFPAVVAFHLSKTLIATFIVPVVIAVYIDILRSPDVHTLFPLFSYTLAVGVVISCRNVMMEWFRKAEASEQQNVYLIKKLTKLADQDPLTGLANKRYLREYFYARIAKKADHSEVYLIMIDVDHFKRFNDHYGHIKGDECLVNVARCIARSVRNESDLAVRFGGEEFAVLLFSASREAVISVAGRIRESLAASSIPHEASDTAPWVTVSQGAACWQEGMALENLITLADQQLYQSKNQGRDRISMA